MKSHLL